MSELTPSSNSLNQIEICFSPVNEGSYELDPNEVNAPASQPHRAHKDMQMFNLQIDKVNNNEDTKFGSKMHEFKIGNRKHNNSGQLSRRAD